ncbi:YceK/YidQ family lipoprotein [Frederiksenia canicola]|nr:YceK/YidQ family lipoprotein [Frederiksenia canicola]
MKLTACKLFFLTLCLFHLTGCGTITSLSNGDYSIYAGVGRDFDVIRDGGLLSILAVIDLPLSFVLDTLLLPITLTQ